MKRVRFALLVVMAGADLLAAQAQVPLSPCTLPGYDGQAQCGTLEVREDRSLRGGRRIPIRVAVLPATGPSKQPDPIVVLQGGPGQAATELAGFYGGASWTASRADRDIWLVDQRGTGGSNPLRCDFGGRDDQPQTFLGDLFPAQAVRRCRADLESRADLAQYTTLAAVEDLYELRLALGVPSINLYGTSYGTRVALAYAQRHPTSTRSVVLKGVVSPDVVIPVEFAADTQRAVDLLVRDCAADAACAATAPDLRGSLDRVFAAARRGVSVQVPATGPLPAATVTLRHDVLAALLRSWLQATPSAARLPWLFVRAAAGDWVPLAQYAVETRRAQATAVYSGMTLSVICTEDAPLLPPRTARRPPATYLGTYWVDQIRQACALWPRGWATSEMRNPVPSSIPTLIVSGDLDPATPPSGGERVKAFMTSIRHVVVPGGSHSFAGMAGCIDGIVAAFYRAGSPDGLDVACAARIGRPPWGRD